MSSPQPRTPVLVGVGTSQQREEDPANAREPLELMIAALERAARDAGSRELLRRADSIRAPRGFWSYLDPCRAAAERFGASSAQTQIAEIGVLQTTLLGGAARDIAQGRADIVLLMGGEARYRDLRAARTGAEAPLATQPEGTAPDVVLRPGKDIISTAEIRAGLGRPVNQYAMIENALRAAEGTPLSAHQRDVAEMWARMSEAAAENPAAWSRQPIAADVIRLASADNPMLAFPYTKLHNSNWNVDQAAGLIFCSAERAQQLGIPRNRWVFPLAVADSNHMVPLCERKTLHRSPGFALAGRRACSRAGCDTGEIAHLELYSCFPVAVRVQTRELEIAESAQLSVTGGMAFGGGPLNNFVLQALARMAEVLRADPGSLGLVSAVSGILTKQGVSLWSSEPGKAAFGFDDVSREAALQQERVELVELVEGVEGASGDARIASYTVLFDRQGISTAILLCDLEDGRRTIATCGDRVMADELMTREGCGRAVRLRPDRAPQLLG